MNEIFIDPKSLASIPELKAELVRIRKEIDAIFDLLANDPDDTIIN